MKSREDSLVMVEETKKAKSPVREYAEAIEMKRVPELRFVFDGMEGPGTGGAPCSG